MHSGGCIYYYLLDAAGYIENVRLYIKMEQVFLINTCSK
jgi:hypothetical protein